MSLIVTGNTLQENFYSGLIARFLKENDTLPHIHVEGGAISGKYNIPTAYNTVSSIQDYAATPSSPLGGQQFKDRKITLGKWMLYQEFLPIDLKQYWAPYTPAGGEFLFHSLPTDVQSTMLGLVFNETGGHMSKISWKGDTALSTDVKYFDGFEKLAKTDPDTVKISGVTLTSGNILATIDAALTTARGSSDAFRIASYKPEMKVFMSYKTFELYGAALKALTNKSISYEQATPKMFAGITVVPQAYVSDDAFIFAAGNNSVSSDLWMAVNSVQDADTLKVEKLQNNSEKFFAKMVLSAGVAFVKPEEVAIRYK
ncbi:MAG TPA: hypothetical protein VK658_08780 [Chryseolinea sp.]|nr:hypothetical protein [Chryseolinea sp.]